MSQAIDFAGGKRSAAFPLLTDEQIELFGRFGQERTFEAGGTSRAPLSRAQAA